MFSFPFELTLHSAALPPPQFRNHESQFPTFHVFELHLCFPFVATQQRTTKASGTKRPPVTKRTVQVKGCDDDDNIRAQDEQTLTGKIMVQDCPCEKRFANNATRLAAVAATVERQLRAYFQQLYKTNINYPVKVTVERGNQTHTVFTYVVQVPKSDHQKAKEALKKTCKDDEVSAKHLMLGVIRCDYRFMCDSR